MYSIMYSIYGICLCTYCELRLRLRKKKKKRHYGGKILSHDRYDIFFDISLLYIMLRQCLEYAEL